MQGGWVLSNGQHFYCNSFSFYDLSSCTIFLKSSMKYICGATVSPYNYTILGLTNHSSPRLPRLLFTALDEETTLGLQTAILFPWVLRSQMPITALTPRYPLEWLLEKASHMHSPGYCSLSLLSIKWYYPVVTWYHHLHTSYSTG